MGEDFSLNEVGDGIQAVGPWGLGLGNLRA